MPKTAYDEIVQRHYDKVAATAGSSPASTMPDEVVRAKETACILDFVSEAIRAHRFGRSTNGQNARRAADESLLIVDVGCGNGYSLSQLKSAIPEHRYLGIEYNDKLRAIAASRISAIAGDLRDAKSIDLKPGSADIVICQRVIINIMDEADQRRALDNIVSLAAPGAALLFIESFAAGLRNLNEARQEFDLPPLPPAEHNLLLPDDFFQRKDLTPLQLPNFHHPANELSTHYFVSRVLHDLALSGRPFVRNSNFVRFMSAALPMGIGDYSPLRIYALQKLHS
jgi:SAM-dependent methyltransferase